MANKDKKQLIEESRAIRWMKLANIAPLAESFVKETFGKENEEIAENEEVDEILTQNQARARGDTDRLNENDEEGGESPLPPEAPTAEPEMGDEMGGMEGGVAEGDVESFLAAVGEAVSGFSGVPVEVSAEGGEGGEGGEEMGGEEVPAEEPEMEQGMMEAAAEEMEEGEEPEALQEEQSPVGAKTTSSSMNNPPTPKATKQADPGNPKDPMKGEVRVKGAEKPTQMEADSSYYKGGGHAYKALEERLMKRVYERLIKDIKEAKVRKESKVKKEALVPAASPANVPAKTVAVKPGMPSAKPTMKPVARPALKPAVPQARPMARPVARTAAPAPVAENKNTKKK